MCTGAIPHLAVHLQPWARARGHGCEGQTIIKGTAASGPLARRRPGRPGRGTGGRAGRPGLGPGRPRRPGRGRRAAARRGRPGRPADGVGGAGPQALRPGRRRPVGPGHGHRLDGAVDHPPEVERRRRPGHDLPGRERTGRPARPRPLPRAGSTPTTARSSSSWPCSWPTRPATSRCSPAGPGCGGAELGVSGAGGRASLQTLLDEPDFSTASFLLSVLGEGTFLSLLSFLERHAPDPVTAAVAAPRPPGRGPPRRLRPGPPRASSGAPTRACATGLRAAVERRHDALASTAGSTRTCSTPWSSGRRDRGRLRRIARRLAPGPGTPGRHGRGPSAPAGAPRVPPRRCGRPLGPAHPQLHVSPVKIPASSPSSRGSTVRRSRIVRPSWARAITGMGASRSATLRSPGSATPAEGI